MVVTAARVAGKQATATKRVMATATRLLAGNEEEGEMRWQGQ
jgi:hypothetical protein